MLAPRLGFKVVCVKDELYVFGGQGYDNILEMVVGKYSFTSNEWTEVGRMYDDRKFFCICSFMKKILIIGGMVGIGIGRTNSCLNFDTNNNRWNKLAEMNEARSSAACAVFKERIVVAGGLSTNRLNTVESYDVLPNKWSTMPKMNSGKYIHNLVVVKNKLFVISKEKNSCEILTTFVKSLSL